MTGLLIGEQLLHGYDIAQALNVEWPIGDQPARLTVQAVLPVLPALVDSEAAARISTAYELAIDGGPRVIVRFPDGTASIGPAEGRPSIVSSRVIRSHGCWPSTDGSAGSTCCAPAGYG